MPRFEIQNTIATRTAPAIAFGGQPDCGSKIDTIMVVNMSHTWDISRPNAWKNEFTACTVHPRGAAASAEATSSVACTTAPSGPRTRTGFWVCHASVRAVRTSRAESLAVTTTRHPASFRLPQLQLEAVQRVHSPCDRRFRPGS